MSLTRSFLAAMGIESEKVEEIIKAHTETVNGLKDEISTYKKDSASLAKVQKELDEMKEAAKDGGKNPFEEKYNTVKKEFDDYKSQVAAKELLEKKKAAYRELCKDAELSEKGTEKAIKYADWSKVELDENGEIKGKAEHLKGVKEEWSDYVQKVETSGAEVKTPLAGEKTPEHPNRAAELAAKHRAANYGIANTNTDNK